MTRKDYIVLAEALLRTKPDEAWTSEHANGTIDQFRTTVRSIADALQADNGRFDRACFYAAAGYETDLTSAQFEVYS